MALSNTDPPMDSTQIISVLRNGRGSFMRIHARAKFSKLGSLGSFKKDVMTSRYPLKEFMDIR